VHSSIDLQIRFLNSQWSECIQTLLVVTSFSKWYYQKISRLDLLQLRFYDFSEKVRKSASVEWVKAVSGLFYDGVGHSKSPATFWQRHTYLLPCQSPASVSITQSSSRGHGQNTNRNATYSTLQLNPIVDVYSSKIGLSCAMQFLLWIALLCHPEASDIGSFSVKIAFLFGLYTKFENENSDFMSKSSGVGCYLTVSVC